MGGGSLVESVRTDLVQNPIEDTAKLMELDSPQLLFYWKTCSYVFNYYKNRNTFLHRRRLMTSLDVLNI